MDIVIVICAFGTFALFAFIMGHCAVMVFNMIVEDRRFNREMAEWEARHPINHDSKN